ncbi:MAG: FCD domain-containing protein [Treponema sp.]|jgi:GntR family transcriptional repressor for pyruvate dehydrogenase complex|nr:FCD domain-containing protein [Treponema sp.]
MGIIKKQKSSSQIIDYVLEKIEKRELKPGDKLMNERDFSELLGVSRVPFREAISALSALGILTVRQGEGTFVSQYDPKFLSRILYTYFMLDNTPLEKIMEISKLLEAGAALLACQNANDNDIMEIGKAMTMRKAELEKYISDNDIHEHYDLDKHFHQSIAQASHNAFFVQFLNAARYYALELHVNEKLRSEMEAGEIKAAVNYHEKIYDAIKKRDAMKAYELMYRHVEKIGSAIHKKK